MLATHISPGAERRAAGWWRHLLLRRVASATRCGLAVYAVTTLACINLFAQTNTNSPGTAEFAAKAHQTYEDTKAHYQADSNNPDAGWHFAKACFDWAEFATNNAVRAGLAEEGISASRHLLTNDKDSVPGHYYLGMNLGQLARTKSIGALKIVTQMEVEFDKVLDVDATFDYAGADRNLGLLYLFAPGWPLSVGNKSKARLHLQKAVQRTPDFPGNRLNLIEAEISWGDKKEAGAGLEALDQLWPEAKKRYAGELWTADWVDWEKHRDALRKQLRPGASGTAAVK